MTENSQHFSKWLLSKMQILLYTVFKIVKVEMQVLNIIWYHLMFLENFPNLCLTIHVFFKEFQTSSGIYQKQLMIGKLAFENRDESFNYFIIIMVCAILGYVI